ncbi:hypothetical protein KJ632_05080 [Patescibacteria group bacterium]|nr:hypothetical protein [Patescibacteria group bacterium]
MSKINSLLLVAVGAACSNAEALAADKTPDEPNMVELHQKCESLSQNVVNVTMNFQARLLNAVKVVAPGAKEELIINCTKADLNSNEDLEECVKGSGADKKAFHASSSVSVLDKTTKETKAETCIKKLDAQTIQLGEMKRAMEFFERRASEIRIKTATDLEAKEKEVKALMGDGSGSTKKEEVKPSSQKSTPCHKLPELIPLMPLDKSK